MSAVLTPTVTPSPWRTALPLLALLLAAIGWLFRDTAVVMAGIWWRSETFAHCMLVPPITLWLVWRKRAELAALTPRPQPWVLLAMVPVAAAWLLAELAVVNAATQFAFVTLLILAVPAVLGLEVAFTILFPLLFLYFGVPFGEFMLPTMMEWTADFTVFALQLSGIPVFREGQNFVIPSGRWSVIDECSGVRYVMASVMVGSLFAYLNYRSYWRRAVFMVVALVLPVLANWLRAYMIVMMAHLSGNKIAVGVDHILYGWVFFGLIIFIMFLVGSRWSQAEAPPHNAGSTAGQAQRPAGARAVVVAAVAAAAVAAAPHLALAVMERADAAAAPAIVRLPVQLAPGWSGESARIVEFTPQYASPSATDFRAYAYAGAGGTVGVHLAYFRGQNEERKLVSSQNMLVGMRDAHWALPITGSRRLEIDSETLNLRTAQILGRDVGSSRRPQLTVWRLYWIDGRWVAGDVEAKLTGMMSRLRGHGDDGALLLLYADAGSAAASNNLLERFARDNLGRLDELLRRARGAR